MCFHASICVSVHLHTYITSTNQNTTYFTFCAPCTFMCVSPYVCLCMWISVFVHSWPSRTMNNKLYFDVPYRWTSESASFDFLAFDMAASQHQWLDETRAAALRGSSLTLSLSPSLPLPSVLLYSGQVNLFHMTLQKGPSAKVSSNCESSCSKKKNLHFPKN